MNIADTQREIRYAFLGGFAGQYVSSLIWLIAASLKTWLSTRAGISALFLGSMGIFPFNQMLVRLLGCSGMVSPENKLWGLGPQIAFTVPINFLLVGAATLFRVTWFFPAAKFVVGSHYLPFIILYGMNIFGILASVMVVIGAGLVLYGPHIFTLGVWLTGIRLIVFGFVGGKIVLNEEMGEQ